MILILALTASLLPAGGIQAESVLPDAVQPVTSDQGHYSTVTDWTCGPVEPLENLPSGASGYRIDGCSYAGPDGSVLLPAKHFYFAVPPGSEVTLDVEPGTVTRLSRGSQDVYRVDPDDGCDVFTEASPEEIPSSWGEIVDTGVWRRAGFAHVVVHPVIASEGDLLSAGSFRIVLGYSNDPVTRPVSVRGDEGELLGALFTCGNSVWIEPRSDQGPGPFWGLPWARIRVDTAGVYVVNGSDVPGAVGSLSSTLSLFCGRGREMGTTPWDSVYVPLAVPILVEDGGDGVFDSDDRLIFLGRGLSWWYPTEDPYPSHFMSRYSRENCYWLTWGGEAGARMNVIDGNPGSAPPLPGDYLARYHFEMNQVYAPLRVPGDWAWDVVSGNHDQWAYHSFDCPEAHLDGRLRISLASVVGLGHHVRVLVNGVELADTMWNGTGSFDLEVRSEALQPEGNMLAIEFLLSTPGSDELYLDWFEVFPMTEYTSSPGQVEVPLEWIGDTGRYRVDWETDLTGCYAFQSSADTLASVIQWDGGNSFEIDIPSNWLQRARSLWVADEEDLLSPLSVEECSPGRILGTLTGGDVAYVYAELFSADVEGLDRPDRLRQFVSAQEVYDEFNGGVRDPAAIRVFMNHCIRTWNPAPSELVLVGYGNWDPRQYQTSKITYIDILQSQGTGLTVDDLFTLVSGSAFPQAAVSRISIDSRTELQLVSAKSLDYATGEYRGNWQSVIIAAADDERSARSPNWDEVYHTRSTERIINEHIPVRFRPRKLYEIFFEWNSQWKKPEARQAYIDMWSDGALISYYFGHGGYDQLADEGLLYLADISSLICSGRLPFALFASCSVGQFQNPVKDCIAQEVTLSPGGGAILALGATTQTSGIQNEYFVARVMDRIFEQTESPIPLERSVSMCVLLGKLDGGWKPHDRVYVLFGDGSLELAIPDTAGSYESTPLLTGEQSVFSGEGPGTGVTMVQAFESARPDTYYTHIHSFAIPYIAQGQLFYRGALPALPEFSTSAFVPVDADTGALARVEFFFIGDDDESLYSLYPFDLDIGSPSTSDTTGPEIELWIDGFRYNPHPVVSGNFTVRATLTDESGINLLGNPGTQLALYLDGTPQDVSRYFSYNPGSGESGELEVPVNALSEGERTLQLRAADGLLNLSIETIEITVLDQGTSVFGEVFVYPNPCSETAAFSWTQTAGATAEVCVYTLAGRKIFSSGPLTGEPGYNQYVWNCTDGDGDRPATGSYIYRITLSVEASADPSDSHTGVIAVVR